MTSASFLGTSLATLCGYISFSAPFRRRFGAVLACFFTSLHTSSLKGNRSSIISLIWSRFWYRFCAFLMHFCWKRTKFLEVVWLRCVVEAAPQARPEDHLGGIFRSSFAAEYHLGLTSALQHCQHNGAFRFLAAQVFSDFGWFGPILGTLFESFLGSDGLNSLFFLSLFPGNCLHRFLGGIIDSWSS